MVGGGGAGSRGLKRAVDIVVSSLLLAVGLPAGLLVLIVMGADMLLCPRDRGGFLDRERRVSRGREFDLLKLRTLRADRQTLTWAGGSLLKPWYLDELPQLVNILRGEMSLVGPRPWPPAMVEAQVARGVDYRQHVTAGWTGPAQVSKGMGASYEELDLAYVERCERSSGASLARYDLGVLRRTIGTLRRGEGLRY